jgi:hypothetical protein
MSKREDLHDDDFASHCGSWREALVIALGLARVAPPDVDDKAYWQHELRAYDEAFASYAPGAIPDDFRTHHKSWRDALVIAHDNAEVRSPDVDNKAYWQHELNAYDRAFAAIGVGLTPDVIKELDARRDLAEAAYARYDFQMGVTHSDYPDDDWTHTPDNTEWSRGVMVMADNDDGFGDREVPVKFTVRFNANGSVAEAVAKDRNDRVWGKLQDDPVREPHRPEIVVPQAVKDHVNIALNALREQERALLGVQRARGNGYILALELRDRQEKIQRANERLGEFRRLAPKNGVDAEEFILQCGGEPDFSQFGVPAAPERAVATPADATVADGGLFRPDVKALESTVSELMRESGWSKTRMGFAGDERGYYVAKTGTIKGAFIGLYHAEKHDGAVELYPVSMTAVEIAVAMKVRAAEHSMSVASPSLTEHKQNTAAPSLDM